MNLTDFLREHNVSVAPDGHHHSRAGWVQIDCPFCHAPGHYRLGISQDNLGCNCWTCGRQNVVEVLAELTGLPLGEVLRAVGEHRRGRLPQVRGAKPRGRLVLPNGVGPLLLPHRTYLEGRGFDPDELAEVWGLGGIGIAPKLSWRVFIPAHLDGKVVSWTTRSISDRAGGKRYVNARPDQEVVPIKELLYGSDLCRHAVVVVEGPVDVWAIGPGAVCTLGTAYSQAQTTALVMNFPVRAVCFDSEPAAQRRAEKLCDELAVFPGKTVRVELETGKDAASAKTREVRELRRRFLE